MSKKTLKFKSRSKPKSRSRSRSRSKPTLNKFTLKKSIFNPKIQFEKLPQFKTILQKPYSGEKEIKINKIKTEKNTDFPFISNLSLLNKTRKPRKYTLKNLFLFNKKKKNNKNKNKIKR